MRKKRKKKSNNNNKSKEEKGYRNPVRTEQNRIELKLPSRQVNVEPRRSLRRWNKMAKGGSVVEEERTLDLSLPLPPPTKKLHKSLARFFVFFFNHSPFSLIFALRSEMGIQNTRPVYTNVYPMTYISLSLFDLYQ